MPFAEAQGFPSFIPLKSLHRCSHHTWQLEVWLVYVSLPVRDRETEDMTLTMHREGKPRNKGSKGMDKVRGF